MTMCISSISWKYSKISPAPLATHFSKWNPSWKFSKAGPDLTDVLSTSNNCATWPFPCLTDKILRPKILNFSHSPCQEKKLNNAD